MKVEKKSAHERVIANYFETTSAKGSSSSDASLISSAQGLSRRLRPWLDVKGMRVVDLGSGTGELCGISVSHGAASVVGVNMSEGEIEYARTITDADFVMQDIGDYLANQPDESIDRIYAINILEHLDKDQLVEVLEQAYRCLSPGGSLVAMVPNATSPFGGMTRYWDITHYNAFTPSSVLQLAQLVGFGQNAEFRECGPIPHGIVSGIRYLLWRFIRQIIRAYLLVELASGKGGVYTADMMFRLTKKRSPIN
jgi:SAM-dependent methyltransferase